MKELKNAITLKRILGICSMVLLYSFMDSTGIKKYAITLVLCFGFGVLGRKKLFNLSEFLCVAAPSITYILLGGIGLLFGASPQTSALKVILYCISPLLLSVVLYIYYNKDMDYLVNVQFLYSALFYLATNYKEVFWPIIRAYRSNFFVLFREFRWETSYAFAFGIFAVYYVYRKKWGMFLAALLLSYIGNKRIVLLAMAVSLAVMAFSWLFKKNKKLIYVLWGSICTLVYSYLAFIYSGGMTFWSEVFNLNSNGRLKMYDRIMNEFSFSIGYFGKGIGVIENLLEHWNITTFANLHNDLLKFYIEIGFWGLLIYLLSYFVMLYLAEKRAGESAMMYVLGILSYTFILFATDNVSIYLVYLVPFYTTIFSVLSLGKKDAARRSINAKEDN